MSTLFVRGLKFVRLVFFAGKGKNSENRIAQEERLHKIERELQQVKDKVFLQHW
jgi:hypothetical protein